MYRIFLPLLAGILSLFFLPTLSWAASSATIRWSDNSGNHPDCALNPLPTVNQCDREDGFKIERNANGGAFIQIGTVGANQTATTDPVLNPDTTYCYRIRGYNAAGDGGYSIPACAKTPPATQPGTVVKPGAPGSATVIIVSTPGPGPIDDDNNVKK